MHMHFFHLIHFFAMLCTSLQKKDTEKEKS